MTDTTTLDDLVRSWAAAEARNDATALGRLLTDDFTGVGPLGFVLPRDQWLARFDNGLENRSFTIGDVQPRVYGQAAVVVGVLTQEAGFQGRDASGRFRITLVLVRAADAWRLAGVHIGPLRQPPAAPPAS